MAKYIAPNKYPKVIYDRYAIMRDFFFVKIAKGLISWSLVWEDTSQFWKMQTHPVQYTYSAGDLDNILFY